MNYSFICRASKMDKNGFAPIECSIILNGKRSVFNLDRRERPSVFKKLISQKANNDLKTYLDLIRVKLNKGYNELMIMNLNISVHALRDYLRYDGIQQYTMGDLVDAYLKHQYKKVVHGDCKECVYNKYVIITNHLLNHINKYVELNAITPSQIDEFKMKLCGIYSESTLAGHLFRVKSIFNYAVENSMMRTNPFKIKVQRQQPKQEFLEIEEVELIKNKDFGIDRLNKIRDLFVCMCGCGLAYSDLCCLKPEDLIRYENTYIIQKPRVKTGNEFTAVLLPWAVEILDKYNGVLPTVSNQRFNGYLKEIGCICGIKKNLHTHVARKTYATYLLNNGCRLDVVSKAIGDTSTRMVSHTYAFLQQQTVIRDIVNILK